MESAPPRPYLDNERKKKRHERCVAVWPSAPRSAGDSDVPATVRDLFTVYISCFLKSTLIYIIVGFCTRTTMLYRTLI